MPLLNVLTDNARLILATQDLVTVMNNHKMDVKLKLLMILIIVDLVEMYVSGLMVLLYAQMEFAH